MGMVYRVSCYFILFLVRYITTAVLSRRSYCLNACRMVFPQRHQAQEIPLCGGLGCDSLYESANRIRGRRAIGWTYYSITPCLYSAQRRCQKDKKEEIKKMGRKMTKSSIVLFLAILFFFLFSNHSIKSPKYAFEASIVETCLLIVMFSHSSNDGFLSHIFEDIWWNDCDIFHLRGRCSNALAPLLLYSCTLPVHFRNTSSILPEHFQVY